jgi:hypothetical protein
MADDRDDDDTPPADSKSGKGPKKRFQERDDADDEGDDDRPRKKRRTDDDEEEPRRKRRADDEDADADEDRPKKRRRVVEDDGPRVKANDNIPIVMLLAFIGSAVALLAACVSCGWFSFAWISGDSGGGGGGNEFEVASVSRTGNPRQPTSTVSWEVVAKQAPSGSGYYYAVAQSGGHKVEKQLTGVKKGEKRSFTEQLSNPSSTLEVWVEHRTTPVGAGKKVSNVTKVQ